MYNKDFGQARRPSTGPRRSFSSSRPPSTGGRSLSAPRTGTSSARPGAGTGRPAYAGGTSSVRPPYGGGSSFGGGSSSSRPSYGGGRSFARPSVGGRSFSPRRSSGGGGRGGNRFGQSINPAKFINKAVITEQVEHFVPEHMFADFAIDERIKKNLHAKGYVQPTPIQDKAIPHILRGVDLVGIANTGTGKTAAFLLPLIDKVIKNPQEQILIVVPTRELAVQIVDELSAFTKGMKIHSVTCIGGANIRPQMRDLKFHNNFVIGTPGRLKDLMSTRHLRLDGFKTLVLDEADRMLDMGFINDIKFLIAAMKPERHTLFFSATMSSDIESIIKNFLREPVRISVKTQDTSANVDQDIIRISRTDNKFNILFDLLSKPDFSKVLIFARTKHGAEKLSKELNQRGLKTESIHGNKTHSNRQRALTLFKAHNVQALVATDVAARGLDIAGVTHVINYDVPATYEDYVHRIGRTGRGDMKGKALTFIE
ncbi:MAG: DEAD/DEAH box helicase [bacterium]|nr:DEAD/DEAH box helicase [bacterium]